MKKRTTTVSAAIAIALLACPVTALALDAPAAERQEVAIDRSDFYEPLEEGGTDVSLLASTTLAQISDEMKYFTKYESHGDYDLGFSPGDGYNAVGYYQFDRRWSLIPFMRYCVSYDAAKYSMFDAVIARADEVSDGGVAMYENGELTEIGMLVENAWHAAYETDPEEFSLLQDNYSYNSYFVPSANYLKSEYGFSFEGRADCVSGLVWSMTNLCGASGVRDFFDWASLSNDMTDREVVNALCDAFVTHVADKYPSQPQYHQGWIRRYESERADCLAMLPRFSDVTEGAWYYDTVLWAADHGIMGGYEGTDRFGVNDPLTRAQLAQLLWSRAGKPATSGESSELYSDCVAGSWYDEAVTWATKTGAFLGNPDGTFCPDEPITRAQIAVVLWRIEGTPSSSGDLTDFPDGTTTPSYAADAVRWAVGEGIFRGNGGAGTLEPTSPLTRAAAATVLMRWIEGA